MFKKKYKYLITVVLVICTISFIWCKNKKISINEDSKCDKINTQSVMNIKKPNLDENDNNDCNLNNNKKENFKIHHINEQINEVTSFRNVKYIDKDIKEILNEIKNVNYSENPWKIIFADMDKIIIQNSNYILTNRFSKEDISSIIDLNKFNTKENDLLLKEFSISPDGKHIVIYTGSMKTNEKGDVYYCNFNNNMAVNISEENYNTVIDTWSYNGNFYAYGNKNGEKINVYDTLNNKLIEIPFEMGTIKDIFICDDGNIIVNCGKKYLLNKEEKYKVTEMNIPGKIISYRNENLIFYDNGIIYNYNCGKTKEITKIKQDYNLVKYNGERAIFSNYNSIMVFSFETKKMNNYNFKYEELEFVYFSPNSQKCILMDEQHQFKLINSDGKIYDTNNEEFLNYLGEYRWLDNNNIIRLEPMVDANNKMENLQILKINIETGEKNTIYKF